MNNTTEEHTMTNKEYNKLKQGDNVSYDIFSNLQFNGEIIINSIKHVILLDCEGTEKTVYKSLFMKYGKLTR